MKAADRKRLEVWVTNRMNEEQPDEAPLRLFKISHLVEGATKKATILEVPYRDQTEASAIATQLADHATSDANVAGGIQKYEIKALYGNNNLESRGGRFAFKLQAEKADDDDDMGIGSMEVSGRGSLAQQMRHNEQLLRVFAGTIGEVLTGQQNMMNSLSGRLERAESGRSAAYELIERLANERMDREIAAEEAKRRARREELLINAVQQVVMPKLMSQFATTDTKMEALLNTMSDEQLEAFMENMRPEQLPMVLSVYKDIIAKKEANKAKEDTVKQTNQAMLDKAEGVGAQTTVGRVLVIDKTLGEASGASPLNSESGK